MVCNKIKLFKHLIKIVVLVHFCILISVLLNKMSQLSSKKLKRKLFNIEPVDKINAQAYTPPTLRDGVPPFSSSSLNTKFYDEFIKSDEMRKLPIIFIGGFGRSGT
jgi:hypothetical protein